MSIERRLRGATGEFLIVVLGVLVALGVDQWWEGFEDEELSEFYLAALEDDLRQDSISLEWHIDRSTTIENAADAFLTALEPGGVYKGEEFTRDVVGLFLGTSMSLKSSAFQDMRSSGNLRLLPTSDLRRRLQVYYSYEGIQDRFDAVDESIPGPFMKSSAALLFRRLVAEEQIPDGEVDPSQSCGATPTSSASGCSDGSSWPPWCAPTASSHWPRARFRRLKPCRRRGTDAHAGMSLSADPPCVLTWNCCCPRRLRGHVR